MTVDEPDSAIKCLVGAQLAAVTFVRDYLQFSFDGPILNAYVWPTVCVDSSTYTIKSDGYRDELCKRINHDIVSAYVEQGKKLAMAFDDGSSIYISLLDDDRSGPEAAMLQSNGEGAWSVW